MSPDSQGQAYKGVRTGGRSARVRQAVLAAAVEELAEFGYASFSLPRIAQRAGVHLSTVYRRWTDQAGLILDLATELTAGMVPDPVQGTLREDLLELGRSVAAMLREPSILAVLRAAFVLPEEQLGKLREIFWTGRFEVAQAIIDRAATRGELPQQTSGWVVVEPIQATIWMRLLITGLDIDDSLLERLVDHAIANVRPRH